MVSDTTLRPGANVSMTATTKRSLIAAAGTAALLSGTVTAQAGPCSADIARLQEVVRSQTPSLPQDPGIQLHHQPTVQDVKDAENQARAEAAAALDQAEKADAQGDATACAEAITKLKKLYAIS